MLLRPGPVSSGSALIQTYVPRMVLLWLLLLLLLRRWSVATAPWTRLQWLSVDSNICATDGLAMAVVVAAEAMVGCYCALDQSPVAQH